MQTSSGCSSCFPLGCLLLSNFVIRECIQEDLGRCSSVPVCNWAECTLGALHTGKVRVLAGPSTGAILNAFAKWREVFVVFVFALLVFLLSGLSLCLLGHEPPYLFALFEPCHFHDETVFHQAEDALHVYCTPVLHKLPEPLLELDFELVKALDLVINIRPEGLQHRDENRGEIPRQRLHLLEVLAHVVEGVRIGVVGLFDHRLGAWVATKVMARGTRKLGSAGKFALEVDGRRADGVSRFVVVAALVG